MIIARPSSSPVWSNCAQSTVKPRIPLDLAGEPAWSGTAFHTLPPKVIRGEAFELDAVAKINGVSVSELGFLFRNFLKLWKESPDGQTPPLVDLFPDPHVEEWVEFIDDEINSSGTPDLWSYIPELMQLRLADWKTGRNDHDAMAQLKVYAAGLIKKLKAMGLEVETVWFATVRVRDGAYDSTDVTPVEQVTEWWALQVAHLKRMKYTPGPHCSWCQRAYECEAKALILDHGVKLTSTVDDVMAELPEDLQERGKSLANAVEMARWMKNELERFLELAKAEVVLHQEHFQDSIFVKEVDKTYIKPAEALPIIRQHLNEKQVNEIITIGKGKLEGKIKENVPLGKGAKAIREVLAELEAAGALDKKSHLEMKTNPKREKTLAARTEHLCALE